MSTTTKDGAPVTAPPPTVTQRVRKAFVTDKAAGRVGLHRALGWGSVDMFISGTGGFIGGSLLFFYTTFAGISPLVATFTSSPAG